jgi:phage baseplate assembly protein gpV
MQTGLIYAYEAFKISTQKNTQHQWDRAFTLAIQALDKQIRDAADNKERKCVFKIPDGVTYDRLHNRLTAQGYVFELSVSQDGAAYLTVKW